MKLRSEAARVTTAHVAEKSRDERAEKVSAFLAHDRFPSHPRLRPDLERVVSTLFVIDVEKEHARLVEGLIVGGVDIGERGAISQHLDRAEENARKAHLLYCVAQIDYERWSAEQEKVRGAIWQDATSTLQREKDGGQRSKQITDADVRARCAELHPDEFAYVETRAAMVKRAVEHMRELLECWRSRAASLRVLLETRR